MPAGIDNSDPDELTTYSAMLKQWIQRQVPAALQQELDDLFDYGIKTHSAEPEISATEHTLLERYYRPEKFELITWIILS